MWCRLTRSCQNNSLVLIDILRVFKPVLDIVGIDDKVGIGCGIVQQGCKNGSIVPIRFLDGWEGCIAKKEGETDGSHHMKFNHAGPRY